ncbi:MAG: M24 family metallopeptidase [Candidatus Competibacteraceae bacterium]
MQARNQEIHEKLDFLRGWLGSREAGAIRLRGIDWFAWVTAGGSNAVLLAAETGVAEVLVTTAEAYVLTDAIEAQRLQDEEVPVGFEWQVVPWTELEQRECFIANVAAGRPIFSDRPTLPELPLPPELRNRRRRLSVSEQARYREIGRRAAEAMSEVMHAARPTWTELELAGAGAEALWARGLHPALTLAAGEQRLPRYRHPTPSEAPLDGEAMLIFCARGYGLYANLTRFVRFSSSDFEWRRRQAAIRAVEAAGLKACRPSRPLASVYDALERAYLAEGFPQAIEEHHQGGITGYLAREVIATARTEIVLETGMALALNPSLPGVKIEDTFLLQADGLENLTLEPGWPTVVHEGLPRPLPLEAR